MPTSTFKSSEHFCTALRNRQSRACVAICACAGKVEQAVRAGGAVEADIGSSGRDALIDLIFTEVALVAVHTLAPGNR